MIKCVSTWGSPVLLRALTSIINLILEGKMPPSTRPSFFGVTLVALEKKGGGIRPIAVGYTLRRFAAKTASTQVMHDMGALLAPHQLGYGIPLGAEATVHAARIYLYNLQPDNVLLKLDFRNAFNCIGWDKMLKSVEELAPELFPLVYFVYSEPSTLFWGDKLVQSSEGVQQGDPLGPLLFCLTIHRLTMQLRSEFCAFYLDYGTLGGSVGDVAEDLWSVERMAEDLGLQLNRGKSEVICGDTATRESSLLAAPGLHVTSPTDASLLGSPLGDTESISNTIREKTHLLQTVENRLQYLHSHYAILLLRHSLAIPKVLYLLRTSPCFLSSDLVAFDDLLRNILSSVTNVHFKGNDLTWTQASLLVRYDGLGIRSAVQLALSAFLASAAGSSNLVHQILPSHLQIISYPARDAAFASWTHGFDQLPPPISAAHHQKEWDTPKVCAIADSLLNGASDVVSHARLLATATKESGAWLNVLPVSSLGLRMDDDTIRVTVGLRLRVPLCQPHNCFHCGARVGHQATHGLSSRWSEGRDLYHAAINDIIYRSLTSSKVPSRLEPSGIYRSDGKRPDGMSILPWKRGKALVWDTTCPDTFAPSHVSHATREAGAVAERDENLKTSKYAHLDSSHHFVPVAVETSGMFGPEALSFIMDLSWQLKVVTGEPRSLEYLIQRIYVAVQRGNAASVLGTMGRAVGLEVS